MQNTFATEAAVTDAVKRLNREYRDFCETELPALIGADGMTVTPSQWFRANNINANRGFKAARMEFLNNARMWGWDVKINMQTLELSFCGRIVGEGE